MAITADEFRRHYKSLSDAALLELNPEELNPVARGCHEEEIAARGLSAEDSDSETRSDETVPLDAGAATEEEMVCIVEYDYLDEAELARGLLEGAEIPAAIESEPGVVRLMVPPNFAESALGLLATPLSDEELAEQAEAAGAEEDTH